MDLKSIKPTTWVIIGYFIAMVIVFLCIWKWAPIWQSVLLGIWALVSWVVGFLTARERYLKR